MAAEIEEAGAGADALPSQHLGPDAGDHLLGGSARWCRGACRCGLDGCGQGLAVHLAVRRERQGGEGDEGRGDHRLRQVRPQELAQLARGGSFAGRHEVCHQRALAQNDGRLADPGVPRQGGLDLSRLDAVAAQLDLVVEPAEVLQPAVGAAPGEITGAVEAGARSAAEPVGHEPLCREVRAAQIAARQPRAADHQLPGAPDRRRRPLRIQDVDPGVRDGPAEGDGPGRGELCSRRPDRGLRRAVEVPHLAGTCVQIRGQALRQRLAAAEDLEAAVARPAGLDQHPPGRRSRLHRGRAGAREQPLEELAVTGVLPAGQDHPASGDQGEEDLQPGDVERERGDGEQRLARAETGPLAHGAEEIGERPVRHLNALRPARRARGVEDVRQVVGVRAAAGGWRRALRGESCRLRIEREHPGPAGREERAERLPGDHQRCARVLQHEGHALRRPGRIERQVGSSGLGDSQEGDHQIGRPIEQDADQGFGSDAQPPQIASHLVGASCELRVGEREVATDDRRLPWSPLCLAAEKLGQAFRCGQKRVRVVPLPQGLGELGLAQQRKGAEGVLRPYGGMRQHALEVLQQADHRRGIEEVGAVEEETGQRSVQLLDVEVDVVFGDPGRNGDRRQLQIRQGGRVHRHVLQVEQDLEQRCMAQAALRRQALHQLFEGEVLARERLQRGPARLIEQLAEGEAGGRPAAQGQEVQEVADERLALPAVAAGHRSPHHQVLLPGRAVQQRLEGGEEQHVERDAFGARPGLERLGERARQRQRGWSAAEALHRRPGAVRGQVEHRGRAGELAPPVGEEPCEGLAGEPLPLPGREVRVLDRQLRQPGVPAGHGGCIEGRQLAQRHRDGPVVGGDVVDAEHQEVVSVVQPQQRAPQDRAGLQAKGPPALLDRDAERLGPAPRLRQPAQIEPWQRQPCRRADHLHRVAPALGLVLDHHEAGAQQLVAPHQAVQPLRQGLRLQRAAQPGVEVLVVVGALRIEPVQEPEPLLGGGEGEGILCAAARLPRNGRGGGGGGGAPLSLLPVGQAALEKLQLLRRDLVELAPHGVRRAPGVRLLPRRELLQEGVDPGEVLPGFVLPRGLP